MKSIIERLKSPIVLLQLMAIAVTVATYFLPESEGAIKVISTAITGVISVVAGLNNPADKDNF